MQESTRHITAIIFSADINDRVSMKQDLKLILINSRSYNIRLSNICYENKLKFEGSISDLINLFEKQGEIYLQGQKEIFDFKFIFKPKEGIAVFDPLLPFKTKTYENNLTDIDTAFYIDIVLKMTENFAIYSFLAEGF